MKFEIAQDVQVLCSWKDGFRVLIGGIREFKSATIVPQISALPAVSASNSGRSVASNIPMGTKGICSGSSAFRRATCTFACSRVLCWMIDNLIEFASLESTYATLLPHVTHSGRIGSFESRELSKIKPSEKSRNASTSQHHKIIRDSDKAPVVTSSPVSLLLDTSRPRPDNDEWGCK